MDQYKGILGILTLLTIAYAMSNNRNKISFRTIYWGLSLQIVFAVVIRGMEAHFYSNLKHVRYRDS